MAREFKGSKYDSKLTRKEIAARIRQDIKDAVASKDLPRAKYSVRCSPRGRTIRVEISNWGFMRLTPAVLDHLRPAHEMHTPQSMEVEEKVKAIMHAYNHDRSDIMTDYFDVNFYEYFDWNWEQLNAERESLEALRAAAARRISISADRHLAVVR